MDNRRFQPLNLISDISTSLITFCSALFSENMLSQLFLKKTIVEKDISYENICIKTPPKVDSELKEEYTGEYKDDVNNFVKIIENAIPDINLDLFYKNIKTVQFVTFNRIKGTRYATKGGAYNCKNNIIYLPRDSVNGIYHELLHLSSAIYNDETDLAGFRLYNEKERYNIGRGLNEGYTALLGEKFFKQYLLKNGYILEKNIALFLELLIGEAKMIDFYFSANLHGLIKELNKYSSLNETFQFLKNMDFITNHVHKKISASDKDDCQECYEEIIKYLIKCIVNKQKDEKMSSTNDMINISLYINVLNNDVNIKNMQFKKINNNKLNDLINNILSSESEKKVIK